MKTTVNEYAFREAFRLSGRANFSYEGLGMLFDYLEETERDCGIELELDIVALCCDYAEDAPRDIAEYYAIDLSNCEDEETVLNTVMDVLHGETTVIGATDDGSIVYQQF